MTRITVCIPAYRSGTDLRHTLASVQNQSFTDFQVEIAVEPTGSDAIDPLVRQTFARDSRFRFTYNPQILGWAENVAGLLARCVTEYVVVLPHDDRWHPEYLARLIDTIDRHPEASVAYADVRRFGSDDLLRTITYNNTDLSTRLYSYYLQGAFAHSWRGVIRRSCLPRPCPFPHNPFLSFAVEGEFVQHLLVQGAAIRRPEELYFKRGYPEGAQSVSRRWLQELSPESQRAALSHHRIAMLDGIPDPLPGKLDRETVLVCAEIAMLQRGLIFVGVTPSIALDMHQAHDGLRSRLNHLPDTLCKDELTRFLDRVIDNIPGSP